MTQAEYNALPSLLKRKDVMTLAGIPPSNYYRFLEQLNGDVVVIPGYKMRRVRKESLRFLIKADCS